VSNETYEATQGAAVAIAATLRDVNGAVINTYTGAEAFETTVWQGSNAVPEFSPITNWILPSAGTFNVVVTSVQTATLTPGRYEILSRLNDPIYGWVDAYEATLDIVGSAGGIPTNLPPTIITAEEAAANVSGFDPLASGQANLLLAVTDAINQRCDRVFPLTTHDERCRYERGVIRLTHYPVPSVTRLCTGMARGLVVTNGALKRASLCLLPSTTAGDANAVPAKLRLMGFSGGTPVTTDLTLDSYTTLADLVAAINGVGSGWAATIGDDDYSDTPTSDLNPDWGAKGVSANGTPLLIYAHDVSDYEVDYATGVIRVHCMPESLPGSSFGYGNRPGCHPVRCVYQAGYDPVSMPGALKQAAYVLIRGFAQRTVLGLLTQQKINDSFVIASPGSVQTVDDILQPYVRRRIY
jgi:hypothetical protein